MRDVRDIPWLGESTLRRHYGQLYFFYQKIWKQPYSFIIMNARRCFNLNFIFMKVYGKAVPNAERIISNNALALYAEEFARCYRRRQRFPSALIVDDLALHGRSLSRLLAELEELIIAELLNYTGELSRDERYYVRRSLASAVDISIYAANVQTLLIEDIFRQKLNCEHRLYAKSLRSLSQQISTFLQKADVPNTSYVLSYQVGEIPSADENWLEESWSYRGAKHQVFFARGARAQDVNFLPTVRFRRDFLQKDGSGQWLTGMPLFGALDREELSRVCRRALELLDREKFSWFRYILEREHPLLQKQRAQLLSLMLSMSWLVRFLEECGDGEFTHTRSDIEKIARNFGKSDVTLPELKKLADDSALLQALHEALTAEVCALARPFLREPLRSCGDREGEEKERKFINCCLEDIFYDIGMAAERDAHKSVSLRRAAADKRGAGRIALDDMLRWETPRLHFDYPKRSAPAEQKLSCMMSMMDNGLMAMNFDCAPLSGGYQVRTVLKAGELATFSIPRRLNMLIPALALVERDCWRLGLEERAAVKKFISALPDRAGAPDEREQDALSFLKSSGGEFTDLLYDCGHSFGGWEIELLTSSDWLEEGGRQSYLSFVNQQDEGQQFYLNAAKRFLERT